MRIPVGLLVVGGLAVAHAAPIALRPHVSTPNLAYAVGGQDDKPAHAASPIVTAEEALKIFKKGILKLKEAEALELMGSPSSVKHPAKDDGGLQMQWKYSTSIHATFKDDKLIEATGTFSDRLPAKGLTLESFKRLRKGMTEKEAVEILGESNSTAKMDNVLTRSWGISAVLEASFSKEGRLIDYALSQNNAVYFPPGVPLPGLPTK